MKLTTEQDAILSTTGPLKINAVAGSGKTTTLLQYAATRPPGSRILYLAFNRTVKLEASARFKAMGLDGVRVETAHSLAYRHIVPRHGYRVRATGYNTREIANMLGLSIKGEKHGAFILANHIGKLLALFCNSSVARVSDLDYSSTLHDEKAKTFVRNHYESLERGARLLLAQMDRGEIECTHDFYLKKFQLSGPQLGFDYILFDEGQDASPAMLAVFEAQNATRVIVGDAHQQIYSWRGAVNALESISCADYALTASFRFGPALAKLAAQVLSWKGYFGDKPQISIQGMGKPEAGKRCATIARSNLGLLLAAIRFITDNRSVQKIYFEGNLNSYTYAEEGASLYDVLYIYNNEPAKVRDPLIKELGSLEALEEYVDKTEDAGLATLIEIVREYGNEIFDLLRALKARHVGDAERDTAEMIFSTVHRAKGLEYDTVHLASDFTNEAKLERIAATKKEGFSQTKVYEEINLLYVALTRARYRLYIPEALLPKDHTPSASVIVVRPSVEVALDQEPKLISKAAGRQIQTDRSFTEKRRSFKNAYEPWNPELDAELRQLFHRGISLTDLSGHFGRNKGAILSRLRKLGSLGENE